MTAVPEKEASRLSMIHIKDLDAEVTADEVLTAVRKVMKGSTSVRVSSICSAYGSSQNTTVILPVGEAKSQMAEARIRIGWQFCPSEIKKLVFPVSDAGSERESNCDGVDTLHVVSSVPGSSQVNRQSLRKSGPDSSVDVLSSVTSDKEIKFKKLKKPVSSTKSYNNNNGSRARRKRNKKRSFLSLTFQRCKLNSASLSSSLNYRQKLRTPQTSSSSVVSVTRSIAPVIILGSDDDNWSDIEVVADVNDVHVNREGNNIQILHTAKEEKGDFVRVQSRLNLKNANVNCGFHMNSSSRKLRTKYLPISTTSVPVNIQTYSRSNGTTELSSNKIYYDSSGFISNSSFDVLTVNSSFLVDPKNVNLVDNMSEISSMLIHSSSNQVVAKSHCGMTTDNAIGVPRSTNSTLQSVHEEAKGRVLNRCRSSTKKYSSWNQSLVCTKSSTKSETRSNNIRLKELSVVLTPITVKIAKNGIVKVTKCSK
ncbi:uncharacterized protein LOC142327893 [Lycorma delicatula]|uniref:uncharacterized protein LOC142327893 n=1 Tax=Lycorma delicatula TaxID=130591 RepID=UPI003F517AD4